MNYCKKLDSLFKHADAHRFNGFPRILIRENPPDPRGTTAIFLAVHPCAIKKYNFAIKN